MTALTLAAKSRTLSILSLRVGSLNLSSSAAIASVVKLIKKIEHIS